MALAYGSFSELSNQLRFLLFETGIAVSSSQMDYYITKAHRETLNRLQQSALDEGLLNTPLPSHHALDFLDQLQENLRQRQASSRFYHWQRLQTEIQESIANQALALAYRDRWDLRLQQQCRSHGSLWGWLCDSQSPHQIWTFLEQWGSVGHPSHPNFRAKIGFSRREVLQYSPEFESRVRIHWAALAKSSLLVNSGQADYESLLRQHFPNEYALWQQGVRSEHGQPDQYLPLPLHPWQWRHQIVPQFAALIDQKRLLLVPHLQGLLPSMSFRTMMPLSSQGCQIKLATAVHTTSAQRTVSPASVQNGPRLSVWIDRLLAAAGYYQQSLYLLQDLAGLRVEHSGVAPTQHRQLAVLLRQNPADYLAADEIALPLASLFVKSPVTGKALLGEIMAASGQSPLVFFRDYVDMILRGQLHLYLKHGIALEAHQQNTLVVMRDNRPVKLLIRDLGNCRICLHPDFASADKPSLHPDSSIGCEDLAEVRHKFIHGNLQSNVYHCIQVMRDSDPTHKLDWWAEVAEIIASILHQYRFELPRERLAVEKEALLHSPWQRKCLLAMRLGPLQSDYVYQTQENPLTHDE